MATVNLFSLGVDGAWSTSVITVRFDSTQAYFGIPDDCNGYTGKAKVYITIPDISEYSSITLKYSSFSGDGIYDFKFGIFDNTSATSSDGIIANHSFSSSGGTITIGSDILSSLSGTIYVGFYFYGNATSPGVNEYGYPSAELKISSLTATEKTYTLTYNANGGSGAPSAVSGIRSTTISSTVPTRDGYNFLGWSKSSSATYASYTAGDTISISSNTTLYAVWELKTYTITYDANGGSGAPSTQYKTHGVTLTLSTTNPTRTGYTFLGWSTSSTATSATYDPGDTFTTNANTTLYAVWVAKTITVTFDKNDGSNGLVSQTFTYDVSGNQFGYNTDGTPKWPQTGQFGQWDRTGYTLLGWSASSTATSQTYDVYSNVTNNWIDTNYPTITLYAVWEANTYTLTLDGNEGSFPSESSYIVTYNSGNYNSFADWNIPTRTGFKFTGLYTAASGGTKIYDSDGSCVNDGTYWKDSVWIYTNNCTLYAQWEAMGLVYIYDDTGEFSLYQIFIYDDSGWNHYLPYIYNGSSWELYSG